MRQSGDIRGHAMLLEHADDVALPRSCANQALVEPVRLSQLEAYAIDRIEKLRRRRLFAEGMKNPPLMRRQGVGRARGKAPQQRRIVRFGGGDATLALSGRGRRIESQDLIDEVQVPVVVEQSPGPW